MGMTENDWARALEVMQRTLSKLGASAEATGVSIEQAAKKFRETAHGYNVITGYKSTAVPLDAQVEGIWKRATEEKKEPMIDKEYTSVYSDAEFDFDKKKTVFTPMLENAAGPDTITKVQEYVEKTDHKIATGKGCRIMLRNDTSSNWNEATIIPLKGEVCIEYSDDGSECYAKCGDGVRPFRELPYITSPVSITTETMSALGPRGETLYDFITSSYIDF